MSTIKITWTNKRTNLQDIIFQIIKGTKIIKDNNHNTAGNAKSRTNILVINTWLKHTSRDICTMQEYINQGLTAHFIEHY